VMVWWPSWRHRYHGAVIAGFRRGTLPKRAGGPAEGRNTMIRKLTVALMGLILSAGLVSVASGQAAAAPWDNDGGPVTNAVNITVWTRGDNYRAPRVYITTAYGRYVKDARNVGYPKRRPGRTGFSYVAYNVPQGVALKVRVASPYHFLGGERLFFQNFHFTKHQERSVGLIQQGLGSFTE